MSDGTDPNDLDTFEDEAEAEAGYDLEANEADAVEQHLELLPHQDAPRGDLAREDIDPGDAEEQRRVVNVDEDDYRD